MSPDRKKTPNSTISERIVAALLFTVIGLLIMVVFSPWRPLLERSQDYLGRLGLLGLFLVALLVANKRRMSWNNLQLLWGLFIMALAVSLDWVFGLYLIDSVGVSDNTPMGFALLKLNECLIIVGVVIAFTLLSGNNLGSIYLQRGKLKKGLIIGSIAFVVAVAGAIPTASFMFGGSDLTLTVIKPWIPWILVFIFANATMEELLFRGLFLRKLEPYFGKFISNFLIAFIFTGLHLFATYTSDQYLFIGILFPLALAWGYITQKTEGLWASILFHAGMDIPIMLGIFSGLS